MRTLSWHGAHVVATLGISASATKMRDRRFVDPPTIASIEAWAGELAASLAEGWAARIERVSRVVTAYGIDPARFGD